MSNTYNKVPSSDVNFFTDDYTCELYQMVIGVMYADPIELFQGHSRKKLLQLLQNNRQEDKSSLTVDDSIEVNVAVAYFSTLQEEVINKIAASAKQSPPLRDQDVNIQLFEKSPPWSYPEAVRAYHVNIKNGFCSVIGFVVRGGAGGKGVLIAMALFVITGMALYAGYEATKAAHDYFDGGSVFRVATIMGSTILSSGVAAYLTVALLAAAVTVSTGGLALAAFFVASAVAAVMAYTSRKSYDACSSKYILSDSEVKNIKQKGVLVRHVQDEIDVRVEKIRVYRKSSVFFSNDSCVRDLKVEIYNLKRAGHEDGEWGSNSPRDLPHFESENHASQP